MGHPTRTPRFVRRVVTLTALLALAGLALAQDMLPLDPNTWGSNPALALVALAGFVAYARSTPWGKRIDGPILVPAFTLGAGAVGGVFVQLVGSLTFEPYAAWATPLGGLAYGLIVGASAITGVSLYAYGADKLRGAAITGAREYIMGLVTGRFGDAPGTQVLQAVAPLLTEYAGAALTPDMRVEIQLKFDAALRRAGLKGTTLQ